VAYRIQLGFVNQERLVEIESKASRVEAEADYTMSDIVKSTAISGI